MTRGAPVVGEPYKYGAETLICTYVVESAAPTEKGMCITKDSALVGPNWEPRGWFVHFHYPEDKTVYRRFIPFPVTT